jgi:hypothetical protein
MAGVDRGYPFALDYCDCRSCLFQEVTSRDTSDTTSDDKNVGIYVPL